MNVVIVGAGGHGRDLQAIVDAAGHRFVGFLDDNADLPLVIGPPAVRPSVNGNLFVGVNAPAERERLAQTTGRASRRPLVHPSATVGPNVSFGVGCVVAAGAVLDRDVHLGDHVHVHTGVTVTRTIIGAFTTICPGATICGDVTIGLRTVIGAGAVVTNLTRIGDHVVVGAGAVVLSDLPDAVTAVGIPARATPQEPTP